MTASQRELVEVLRQAKLLLALPANEFSWSHWMNTDEALWELNGLIASIESGTLPERVKLTILFAPTGAIQEVGESSGWGLEFFALAARFDAAESRVYDTLGTRMKSWLGLKWLTFGI